MGGTHKAVANRILQQKGTHGVFKNVVTRNGMKRRRGRAGKFSKVGSTEKGTSTVCEFTKLKKS